MVSWTTLLWVAGLTLGAEPSAPAIDPGGAHRSMPAQYSNQRMSLLPRLFGVDLFRRRAAEGLDARAGRPEFERWRRPAPPSDWLLISRCRSILYNDRELARGTLYVTADRGIVTLAGAVPSAAARQRAEILARQIEGVQGVVNHLSVAGPTGYGLPAASAVLAAPELAGQDWRAAAEIRPADAPAESAIGRAEPLEPPRKFAPAPPSNASSAPAGPTSFLWPTAPEPASDRAVALGRPEILKSEAGLPEVVTYIVRRPVYPVVSAVPENRVVLSPSRQQLAGGLDRSPPVMSASRFAIPRPRDSGAVVPTLLVEPPAEPAARTSQPPAPAPLGDPAGLRRDIEAVLRSFDERLTYSLDGGELLLAGRVRTSRELDALFARLCNLPGVETLSFDDLRVDQ